MKDLRTQIYNCSQLSSAQKEDFLTALRTLSLDQLENLSDLFDQEPDLVEFMYKNLLAKREALGNPDKWEAIIAQELDFLDQRAAVKT